MKNRIAYPEIICGTLILNKKGEVLLIKSRKWKGHAYQIPGGHVEYGEALTDAVKREVLEETGLRVRRVRFLSFREIIFSPLFERKAHFIAFQYVCFALPGNVRLNDESKGYLWVKLRDSLKLPLYEYVRTNIKDYIKLRKTRK